MEPFFDFIGKFYKIQIDVILKKGIKMPGREQREIKFYRESRHDRHKRQAESFQNTSDNQI